MPATKTTPWACPTCARTVKTPFCPRCGEEPLRARHLTIRDLAVQGATEFSSVDSKLIRSLRALILKPGELTAAYAAGRRRPFMKPLALFFAANALFFAVQSLSRSNIFASSLASHMNQQDWAAAARVIVARRLASTGRTLADFTPLFDQAAILNAKAMIVLMVLAFALVPPLVFLRQRRPLAAHVVFALHLYAFLLLLFCLSLGIAAVDHLFGGAGLEAPGMDIGLSLFNLAACGTYLYLAIGRVYGVSGWVRGVQTAVLAGSVAALVLGYRFLIFLITVYTI